ncbi:hypothetical protein JHK85_029630 [Glycine max]|nr:hypothetical protein JHK85_029630 [Glycine max]
MDMATVQALKMAVKKQDENNEKETRNINRGASVKLASSLRLLRSFLPSLVSFFVSLSMASGDTDSFSDKVEEKFHDHNSDSDSYSDSDDDHNNRPPPKTTVSNNVYRLFGRDQPVHKVLGGGKRNSSLLDLHR